MNKIFYLKLKIYEILKSDILKIILIGLFGIAMILLSSQCFSQSFGQKNVILLKPNKKVDVMMISTSTVSLGSYMYISNKSTPIENRDQLYYYKTHIINAGAAILVTSGIIVLVKYFIDDRRNRHKHHIN